MILKFAPWIVALLTAISQFLQSHPLPQRVAARFTPRTYLVAGDEAAAGEYKIVAQRKRRESRCNGIRCVPVDVIYAWATKPAEPGKLFLLRDGELVGGYNRAAREYLPYDPQAQSWGTQWYSAPPEAAPAIPAAVGEEDGRPRLVGDNPPGGIPQDKMPQVGSGHKYTINGRAVDRKHAFEALGDPIPDDADTLKITCVGPGCNGAKLRTDLAAAAGPLSAWSGKVSVQTYDSAEAPMIKDRGYAETGVMIQAPSGLPLWYAATYDSPQQLAEGLQVAEVRRKDPSWDPRKWPELAQAAPKVDPKPEPPKVEPPPQPSPEPGPTPSPTTPWYVGLLAMAVAWATRELWPLVKKQLTSRAKPEFTPEELALIRQRINEHKPGR